MIPSPQTTLTKESQRADGSAGSATAIGLALALALSLGIAWSARGASSPVAAQVTCPDASQEPNESKDDAVPLLPPNRPPVQPSGLLAAICPSGDEDWYVFNAPGNSRIRATLADLALDLDLELHAEASLGGTTVIAGSYEDGAADESLAHDVVQPQTYYLRIYGAFGVASALDEYQLRVWYVDIPDLGDDCPDLYEPNERLASAWPITPGESVDAFLCAGADGRVDHDWFAFDVPEAGREIRVALTEHAIDADIRLVDPEGIDVASSTRALTRTEMIRHTAQAAGRHAVQVLSKTGESDEGQPYRLHVTLGDGAPLCNDALEPNDGFASATPIQPQQGVQSRLCPSQDGASDVDWYRLRAGRGDRLRVEMQSLPVPVTLSLWRPDGTYWGGKRSVETNPTSFEATLDADGDWRLALAPQVAGDGEAENTYFLIARLTPASVGCPDGNEPNDERGEARAIGFGAYLGRICDAEDVDWFVLRPEPGLALTITLDALGDDFDLFLYDQSDELVASSENAATTPELLRIDRAEGEPLFLEVAGYEGAFDRGNDYRLHVAGTIPPTAACDEPFEPNERPEDALALTPPGQTLTAWICTTRDRDWFAVDALVGQTIDARLFGLPHDYDLALFGPDGSSIATSEQAGRSAESLTHEATVEGRFFVLVYGYAGAHDTAEPYGLRVAVGDGAPAPCSEAFEPNEDFAAAAPLPPDTALFAAEAWLCDPNDQDWYRIDLTTPTRLGVTLTDLPADYDLRILDESQAELARATRGGTQPEQLELTLPSGAYRIQVYGFEGAADPSAAYSLLVDRRAGGGAGICAERFEPNDERAAASPLALDLVHAGYICDRDDHDWFALEAIAGATYYATLAPPPGIDLELELYAEGEVIRAFSRKPGDAAEAITYTAQAAGTLSWRVYGYEGAADPRTPYALRVRAEELPRPPGCGEWFEPNEDFGAAVPLPLGAAVRGILCDRDDQDWFRIALRPGQVVDLRLRDLPADYDLRLYDPGGRLVATATAGGSTPEHLRYTVADLGAHRVQIFGYGGAFDPRASYELALETTDRDAPPAATPTATASPTQRPSPTSTRTPRARPSATVTATPPPKPTGEPSATAPPKPSPTGPTVTPRASVTASATARPKATASATPTSITKPTATASATASATATGQASPTASATHTPAPTATPTPMGPTTPTAGASPTATATRIATAAATDTPAPSPSPSPTLSPSATPAPTGTATPTATPIIDSSWGTAYLPMLLQGR